MDLKEMRRKWESYGELMNEGDNGGSLVGRSFIIARSGVNDVLKLLDFIERAFELEDDEV